MVHLYRFTQFSLGLILATALSLSSLFAQAQVDQLCNLDNFQATNGHAIWLDNLPGAPSPEFIFNSQGGTLTIYNDGTANITGTVVHETQSNLQWHADIWLINERDFAAWTALGRGIKIELAPPAVVNANSMDWSFYELDDTRSTLTGVAGTFYDGDVLNLSHRPSNFDYGFQLGVGANAKNGNDGLSGWFFYSGAYTGIGDVNVNKSCSAPACDVSITQVDATCINDSSFEVSVTFTGTGNQFQISDNQGRTPLTGLSAGTYLFSSYSNNTNVEIIVSDMSIMACADTADAVTADCAPPPVCDLAIDSLASFCLNDSSFEVMVYVSGTGNFTLSDDQASASQTGGQGVYTFGPYGNNVQVSFSASDNDIANCSASAGPISKDCAPPPPICDVAIDNVNSNCVSDSTFEVSVVVSGTASYSISDNQGTTLSGGAGTYTFGPYLDDLSVSFTAVDSNDTTCLATAGPISADCGPDTCAVTITNLVAECASDTSFQVLVSFTGIGNNFSISDNVGSAPMTGLSPGTYAFGDYFNSTDIFITVSDSSFAGCTSTLGPVTADCTPVPVCDVSIDTAYTNCLTDSTFEVILTFNGTGSLFQIFDNLGTPGVTNLSAGTYSFGVYPNGSAPQVTVLDFAIFNCFETTPPLSATCDTSGTGLFRGITDFDSRIAGQNIELSWKSAYFETGTHYEVERKIGNTPFETVGVRLLSEMDLFESKFFFTDFSVESNKYINYRIKQVRPTGEIAYSQIIQTIRLDKNELLVGDVYPNPSSGFTRLNLNAGSPHRVACELLDGKGALISSSVVNTVVGSQELLLPTMGVRPGMYLLRLTLENNKVFVRKLIITE